MQSHRWRWVMILSLVGVTVFSLAVLVCLPCVAGGRPRLPADAHANGIGAREVRQPPIRRKLLDKVNPPWEGWDYS